MKILAVIHDFLPRHQAGSELYCFYLCRELQRRGHDVRVFCAEIDHEQPAYSVRDRIYEGIPVTEIIQHFHFWKYEETYRNSAVEKVFADLLKSWSPDVVHFHHLLGLSFECPRLARESGAAVVFTLHDYWLLCLRGGGQMFLDDGSVCRDIDPDRCAGCVAEYGLLGRTAGRLAKRLLIRSIPPSELNLRDTLNQAKTKTAKRRFVKATKTSIAGVEQQSILAHPPTNLIYRLPLTTESCLLFSYAMVPSTYDKPGEGVRFRITLNESLLWEKYLDAKQNPEDRGWHYETLDLPACPGDSKLTLETQPGPSGNRDFCAAVWGNPRLILNVGGPVDDQTHISRTKSIGRNVLNRLFGRRYREQANRRAIAALSMAEFINRFICPSPFLKKTFESHGFAQEKLLVSDYGIQPIGPATPRDSIRYPIRFTYIGTLVRHKG
ncbi:MAG: glycosyltransferase, partial [bacterium]